MWSFPLNGTALDIFSGNLLLHVLCGVHSYFCQITGFILDFEVK